jgi:hypothetical protein
MVYSLYFKNINFFKISFEIAEKGIKESSGPTRKLKISFFCSKVKKE